MKRILYLSILISGMSSCSQKPEAGLLISKSTIGAKEGITISNTSGDCDIAYIDITGNALINDSILSKGSYHTDKRYLKLCYPESGVYTVKATAENTSFFSGTSFDTKEYTITVGQTQPISNN